MKCSCLIRELMKEVNITGRAPVGLTTALHYPVITAGRLWLGTEAMHHGSFNYCDFPLG